MLDSSSLKECPESGLGLNTWLIRLAVGDLLFSSAHTPFLGEVYVSCFMQLWKGSYDKLREVKAELYLSHCIQVGRES